MRRKFESVARDGNGSAVANGTVLVYQGGGTTLATVYASETTATAISDSSITTDSDGGFLFWADSGDYLGDFKLVLSKTGYASQTLDDVLVFDGVYGTAAPASGTYKRGDKVWNSAPSAAGYIGWVCVSAGTPGTWKGFGVIES